MTRDNHQLKECVDMYFRCYKASQLRMHHLQAEHELNLFQHCRHKSLSVTLPPTKEYLDTAQCNVAFVLL